MAPGGSSTVAVELLNIAEQEWVRVQDYPKASHKKSILHYADHFYVFGGSGDNDSIYSMPDG